MLITSAIKLGLRDTVEKIDLKDVKGVLDDYDDEREEDVAIGGGYEDMLELHILSWGI